MLISDRSLDDWSKKSSAYLGWNIAEPVALSFNALCVVVYGSKMLHKLMNLRQFKVLPRKARTKVYVHTFVLMFTCSICYMLRSITMVSLVFVLVPVFV